MKRDDQDFYDEIEAHIQLETDQLIAEGMDPEEAAFAARRTFGNVTQAQERFYESNRRMWLDHLLRNTRFALRQIRRAPISTAAILLSLALGVGLNTSMFSLADQALLKALPIEDPASLVQLKWQGTFVVAGMGNVGFGHKVPFPLFRQLGEETEVFEQAFARSSSRIHLSTGEASVSTHAELVTGNFFSALGVRPALGRLLSPSDDVKLDGHPVVVLSHAFWQTHFGGDQNVLGKSVRINDSPMTVVGVASQGFHGMDWSRPPAVWVPMMMKERVTPGWSGLDEHRTRFAQVYARLLEGLNPQQAALRLEPWFANYLKADVERADWPSVNDEQLRGFLASRLEILPGARGQSAMAEKIGQPMLILLGASGLVLLLACLNVANLSLARAFGRRRATAMRSVLGASRSRLLGESLVESALFALMGTALGALMAPLFSRLILALLLGGDAKGSALQAALDPRALLFAILLMAAVTLFAGAAPALFATSMKPIEAFRRQLGGGLGGLNWRRAMVVAQFALALVLLIGAGLFAQTLRTLQGEGPGYETSNLLMFGLSPTRDGYELADSKPLVREVRDRLAQLPDIEQVGVASWPMLAGSGWNNPVTVETADGRIATDRSLPMNGVTPGFFATLDVPILMGRNFTESDVVEEGWNLRSTIINQAFVDRYLEGKNPVGGHLAFGVAPDAQPDIEIIGVVQSFQDYSLRDPEPQVFFALWEGSVGSATFYARTRTSSESASSSMRAALRDIDPSLTVLAMRTVDDQLDQLLVNERILAGLASAFAVLATLLAMIGLYGVLSFSAEQRKKEIGIRMALGAPRGSSGFLIVREAAALAGWGLLLALPAIWAVGRLIEHQLFGVQATDPRTLAAALAALLTISFLASALPAVKVESLNPLEVLRSD